MLQTFVMESYQVLIDPIFRLSMKQIYELDVSSPTPTEWVVKEGQLQFGRMNHACMVFNDAILISGGNQHLGGVPSYENIDSVERYFMFMASMFFYKKAYSFSSQYYYFWKLTGAESLTALFLSKPKRWIAKQLFAG